jgi:hypothetical protein
MSSGIKGFETCCRLKANKKTREGCCPEYGSFDAECRAKTDYLQEFNTRGDSPLCRCQYG